MQTQTIEPGTIVQGYTPGRYARHFTGKLLKIEGEGRARFAHVEENGQRVIKVRPGALTPQGYVA